MDSETDTEEEISDTQGLSRAYSRDNKIYRHGDTLYIAGTSSIGDVMEWPDIPLHKVPQTTRFKTADRYLNSEEGRGINRYVGHSLGGSVALELSNRYNVPATTYGAPVIDLIPRNPWHQPDRYACRFDPVAYLDNGAKKMDCLGKLNPHSYAGLEQYRKI